MLFSGKVVTSDCFTVMSIQMINNVRNLTLMPLSKQNVRKAIEKHASNVYLLECATNVTDNNKQLTLSTPLKLSLHVQPSVQPYIK